MLKIACATLLALAAASTTLPETALAADAAPTAAYFRMQKILTGMGYTPKPQANSMSIVTGNNYTIYLLPTDTSTMIWISLPTWVKGKESHAPLMQALDYSDNHFTYFSTVHYAATGQSSFSLNYYLPGPIDAAITLKSINLLESAANSTRAIWNSPDWK